jgi:heme-degrading monooxygenase HmoA
MTTKPSDNTVVTLNVFTVAPEDQQRLVGLIRDAIEKTVKHSPGFISATIHKSLDGARVANYVRWRSREEFEAAVENPHAAAHAQTILAIAKFDAHLYQVVETISMPEKGE